MKIICTDNYDRDYIPDRLIADNVPDYWAEKIVKFLNENIDSDGRDYFRAVPHNYELKKVEP